MALDASPAFFLSSIQDSMHPSQIHPFNSTPHQLSQLISRAVDHSVRIWDIRSNKCTQVLHAGSSAGGVSAILFDGELGCIVVGERKLAKHRSVFASQPSNTDTTAEHGTGRTPDDSEVDQADVRTQDLVGAVFSQKFDVALAVDEMFTIQTWSLDSGEPNFRFNAERDAGMSHSADTPRFSAIGFDASGRRLLTGSQDARVRVWNFSSGQLLLTCLPPVSHQRASAKHEFEISSVLGFAEGSLSFFAAGTWTHEIWLWQDKSGDTASLLVPCLRVLRGHTEDVLCTVYGAASLASGSYDGSIVLCNISSGIARQRLQHEVIIETGRLDPSCHERGESAVPRDKRLVPVTKIVFLRGEAAAPLLVSGCHDGSVRCWNPIVGVQLLELPVVQEEGDSICALSWCEEADVLSIGTASGYVALWNGAAIIEALRMIEVGRCRRWPAALRIWSAHNTSVMAVQVAKLEGHNCCVTAPKNGQLRLWTVQGAEIGRYGRDRWDLGSLGPVLTERRVPSTLIEVDVDADSDGVPTPRTDEVGGLQPGERESGTSNGTAAALPVSFVHGSLDAWTRPDIETNNSRPDKGTPRTSEAMPRIEWEADEQEIKAQAAARARYKLFGASADVREMSRLDLCAASEEFLQRKALIVEGLARTSRTSPTKLELSTRELSSLSFDIKARPRLSDREEGRLLPRLR